MWVTYPFHAVKMLLGEKEWLISMGNLPCPRSEDVTIQWHAGEDTPQFLG